MERAFIYVTSMRPATPQVIHDGEGAHAPRRAGSGLAALHGLPGDRTGRYRAAMGAKRAWGPLRGQHRLDAGTCAAALWAARQPWRASSCFPFTFRTQTGKCCVLASKMRRKHRFGAETV